MVGDYMMFLSVCDDSGFLSVILLARNILDIISIVVPIILIIMLSIELSKIVMGNTDKQVPAVIKSATSKVIAAVAIFFIPTLVNLLLSMLNVTKFSATACWNNANATTIAEFKAVEEARKIQEKEELGKASEEAKKERDRVAEIREEARKENEKKAEEERKKNENKNGGIMLGDVVYYNQCDPSFGSRLYYASCGSICSCGCGPTSAAIIASTFLGAEGHHPVDAVAWICSHGGCTASGTVAQTNADYLKSLGLNVSQQYSYSANRQFLMDQMATGKYLAIILVHNNTRRNIFTSGGHFFVITGVKNGEFTIAQPSRPAQNNQTWPLSAFDGDAVNYYLVEKP